MKKKIILFISVGLLLLGNNPVFADTIEETNTNSEATETSSKQMADNDSTDIEQEFIISNIKTEGSDNYTVTISWKINPMEFNIANDTYTIGNDTYYVYQTNANKSKVSDAEFTIQNKSKRLIKVTGSFIPNEDLDINYIHNDFSEVTYYLTKSMNTNPGVDEDITFYVWGSLFNNNDNNYFIEKTFDSSLTVYESAFKAYTGSPKGVIGTYHFTVQKA